ncbi:hypothetical protein BGZ60DRAFT_432607 [Tricladium varicosporioides]|nr:hypothetical protein BGZ60DRAFT_432607 [Hymenoscyphus varicosporioides]
MMFLKSAILFGLIAGICATPIPQEAGTDLIDRNAEVNEANYSLLETKREEDVDLSERSVLVARVAIKDKKCPDNGKTYTKAEITAAVQNENSKASPGKYGNKEGGKKLFNTDKQLYKASLDNVARAVFSRGSNNAYEYRGLIEHDKGTGNGFHKC